MRTILFRSSHWRCSVKNAALRNFAKFAGKPLCQSLYFNKAAGLRLYLRSKVVRNHGEQGSKLCKEEIEIFNRIHYRFGFRKFRNSHKAMAAVELFQIKLLIVKKLHLEQSLLTLR